MSDASETNEGGPDVALRAAFARDVGKLLRAADKAGMTIERESMDGVGHVGHRWVASPGGDDGVTVAIDLGRVAVGVRLSVGELSWSHDEVIAVDPEGTDVDDLADALDDALDLAAAALWGSARVAVHRRKGRAVRLEVQFGEAGRFSTFATVDAPGGSSGGALARLFSRPEIVVHRNAVPVPGDIKPGQVGRVASAPWSGLMTAHRPVRAAKEVPVDGVIDLHTYNPKQVAPVVREYIEACRAKGVRELRIIHGKGIGNLRRTVHALLDKHEAVEGYRLGGHGGGSWGATIVTLKEE